MMTRILMAVAATVLVAGPAPAFAQRVTAAVGGISIEKPKDWITQPPSSATENLRKVDFDSPEFQRQVQAQATEPVIVFTKYATANRVGLIPTIKVTYRRLPEIRQMGPVGVLNAVADALREGFGELEVLDAAAPTTVGGKPAAHMRVRYTMRSQGQQIAAISDMWIIQRGDYMLMIGAAYPPSELPGVREEILAAVATVLLTP